jgi:hypothetical protein
MMAGAMKDLSSFLIRPELRLRDGRIITSIVEAIAYVREHEVRPGIDARDEILHRLERAKSESELASAAEAFLEWLEELDLIAVQTARALPHSGNGANRDQAEGITETARDVASNAGETIKTALADKKGFAADCLTDIAGTLRRASHEFDGQMPPAGQYIRRAAGQVDKFSEALRTRDAAELVKDVQDFARRQPVAVLGMAVLAGFAAVRVMKSAPLPSARAGLRST